MAYVTQDRKGDELNRPYEEDLPVHRWYRFVLSYPPHLVRRYVKRFRLRAGDCVLDPFCGTGTTLVECKKLGLPSIGVEANPVVAFAARTKTNWDVDPDGLDAYAQQVGSATEEHLEAEGIKDLPLLRNPAPSDLQYRTLDEERQRLLIKDSISERPLHKVLVLLEHIEDHQEGPYDSYGRLALAKELVNSIGNLRFGPEVGVGGIKEDAPVVHAWRHAVRGMADDLRLAREIDDAPATVIRGDAREICNLVKEGAVEAVITSPPYPNEKDYSRTTRLESVLLGFMKSRKDLRKHKKEFVRSNTRGVYVADTDDRWVQDFPRVQELADHIEQKRAELGKTSGFEKLYHRVVRLYFGGMVRHLESLKPLLRPGAQLAYVVGDQASYFRVLIETGEILACIAQQLGYTVNDVELFRTRFSTTTKSDLKEEVVLLEWDP
ncbi:MAG: DNA methyltransferase [Candidatus Brocadiia bacterium]